MLDFVKVFDKLKIELMLKCDKNNVNLPREIEKGDVGL